ncbi:unnamed protein product, partial [Brenthis ino]
MTALFAAMPQPPAPSTSWSLVEPRKKKNSESDTEESERYTTDGDTSAAAPGGTGNRLADTKAQQSPHRASYAAPGYKGDPSGQSALETARPLSSSGKSFSGARVPPKTTKTIQTHKAPTKQAQRQLLSSRPRLNSGTGDGETSEGGQKNKPNKRDRHDDTISPKVSSKRPRTTHTRRDGEGSYAQAILTHLNVAITTNPRTDLTEKEAIDIKDQLQKAIFTVAGNQKGIRSNIPFGPIFLGRTTLHEGVMKLKCRDDETLA